MKVIFIKDMKKVAKKGDIKEVKDGYAENYLIKNKIAVAYTEKNIKTLNEEKKQEDLLDKEKKEEANKLKKDLEKLTLVYKVKTGDKDRVFGSISPKQIKESLTEKGYKIDKKQIILNSSLASLGFHKVEIEIYKEIKAELKVQLVK